MLEQENKKIINNKRIRQIFQKPAFKNLSHVNILPLIYNEETRRCNILVFDYDKAFKETAKIEKKLPSRGNRKHSVYRLYNKENGYICEVRYDGTTANALQRGIWTHTKNGIKFFDSLINGWIEYSHNEVLVKLFSHALVSSARGHCAALEEIKKDISELKRNIKEKFG